MTVAELPWALDGRGLQLIRVPPLALHALGEDNATLAMELEPNLLTPYLLGEECQGLWRYRSTQITGNPLDSAWITRIAVDARTSTPVGLAGFHGRPDARGMVEIGYRIDPAFRRLGYARTALEILLDVASRQSEVHIVRATISPDNIASRNLISQYGFNEVGEQWDEEDGLETIFEISASPEP
ncbi:GNAT family N-acetyltransferase [Rhodococcus erythropolis]|uniref:GNAT family N-acetyltransferase n=1 Tax=Rhodococcus erythropolis TaxID=1833 RepID=UPI00197F9F20|nr:GNAT family N-acetyltransferase [Rhodococcus erythropolis]QSE41424.1 GNAT family N-acetyltransferase [Rhodococcus erythropolis]